MSIQLKCPLASCILAKPQAAVQAPGDRHALVVDLDSNVFQTRQDAHKRLEALGQAAFVHLVRLREKTQSEEVKNRLDDLIVTYDAKAAFRR
jgi:hypothetical protein